MTFLVRHKYKVHTCSLKKTALTFHNVLLSVHGILGHHEKGMTNTQTSTSTVI